MIHREGIMPLVGLTLMAGVVTVGALVTPKHLLTVFAAACWLLVLFTVYFFRDPDRQGPRGENLVVAPADGKVVEIAEVVPEEYLEGNCLRISIFLSIFDVHVNRAPVSGRVEYFRYHRGEFRPAYRKGTGETNEHTSIGIRTPRGQVLLKQVAGVLARRIVCDLREGDRVEQGERFGMIKFGSRVEVFLPLGSTPRVAVGQKVRGGVDILAELPVP
ncbi:MAG: phosphatidylserine decarboxylase family protein [candidate division KSB1 bacterium]|nr:phosphatidylserine decarboxylase family protein [candidate division KSB1 bacterium]